MNIIVLIMPNCSGCVTVKRYLDEMKVKYEVIDISKHPDVLKKYPIMSVPAVVINGKVEFIGTPGKEELRKSIFMAVN